ncbi:LPS export ABC transporter ATP-binding protein [Acetobacter sp.]|jgi:lipopolysaccharide export system ATP-binding protein|uniref:LPS export ABC transporter ATP-binding protein n=1 Tax=Acetobacter sp. TaxID=440 RepID=UPI0025C43E2B|nr:LPS export ABC transporter ATP-binding protein [Acetobacter sp.]MCH4092003.1 LPS export ABC transporter ATP-binding protein [Acetobacter sp.]MCI1300743.1 LPS export ABC transporter ATP-binding protein [Acetobacter sp.]MCI1317505.1 LPS export ABC transporter ATP-binding protein [Acetobacter sp.]
MLSAFSLSKNIADRTVVRDISLEVGRGEIVGLLGPNGAGKSTTFGMLTGLLSPDLGRIELDGFDITLLTVYERVRRGILLLPQNSFLPGNLSVQQALMIVMETRKGSRRGCHDEIVRILKQFGLASLADSRISTLSGGQKRRCEIAVTMACRPSFTLLDEPFAGVDPVNLSEMIRIIRRIVDSGTGVLITDHSAVELLRLVDRAYIIHDGCVLAQGTPAELVRNPTVRLIYLGEMFHL